MSDVTRHILLNNSSYFALAEEFVQLNQLFKCDSTFEKLNFWIDMVLYPLYTLISILFFNQTLGIFNVMSIHKTVTKWQQYFRYLELKTLTSQWRGFVHSAGGPFISTNDETYHSYVYADGMQRLSDTLFCRRGSLLLTKKSSKRL